MELDALGSEGTVEGRLACVDSGMVRISHSLVQSMDCFKSVKETKRIGSAVPKMKDALARFRIVQ